MCLQNTYYPLVLKRDGKQKILFNYGVKVTSREEFENLQFIRHQSDVALFGLSKYKSLNILFHDEEVKSIVKFTQVPCGCCRECLNNISIQWAFRIMKEASQYDNNWFITFTYNDNNLPSDMMLDNLFYQSFNKKLKKYLRDKGLHSDFRFYGVGEYGSKNARPHYHCIYFNLDLPDLEFHHKDKKGFLHFKSKFLEDTFGLGFIDIGSVDVGSACYVARYCEKKHRLTTTEKDELKNKGIVPEFSAMSRRPGVGSNAFDNILEDFKKGITSHFVKGQLFSLPLYYSKKIKEILKGSPILEEYEKQCLENMGSKLHDLLEVSDRCDLDYYLKSLDRVNKRDL